MSGKHTRPLASDFDPYALEANVDAKPGGSTSAVVKQNSENDNSVNKPMPWIVLCGILAGISFGFSIPAYVQANKIRSELEQKMQVDRAELFQQIQMTETRVIADNREKTTAFTLLDNHVKELKGKLEVQEKLYGIR
jgi:hypothetical protein